MRFARKKKKKKEVVCRRISYSLRMEDDVAYPVVLSYRGKGSESTPFSQSSEVVVVDLFSSPTLRI